VTLIFNNIAKYAVNFYWRFWFKFR